MGVSYGGISQLFVGATRPPSLAAITPLSVIDNTRDHALPGRHPEHRLRAVSGPRTGSRREAGRRRPAARRGRWTASRAATRPARPTRRCTPRRSTCIAQDPRQPLLRPAVADPLAPVTFVHKIRSPVFLACQWTDEQTGGHCPDAGVALHRHAAASGSRSPTAPTSTRWTRRPSRAGSTSSSSTSRAARRTCLRPAKALAPTIFQAAMGVPGRARCPTTRSRRSRPTRPRWRRSRACPRSASCSTTARAARRPARPFAGFEQSFARLPVPGTRARSWYLARRRGAGRRQARAAAAPTRFRWNPFGAARHQLHREHGLRPGRPVDRDAHVRLAQNPAGTALSYVTPPLARQHGGRRRRARCGRGSAPRPPSVDLQVTVSEVRPDGKETFVQNGWLRGERRESSTPRRARCSSRCRACAEPTRRRFPGAVSSKVDRAALLPGPRLPDGLSHPRHDRRARRRPAGLGVRRGPAAGSGHGLGGPLSRHAVAAAPPGRSRSRRTHRAAPLPRAARRAVPVITGAYRHVRWRRAPSSAPP